MDTLSSGGPERPGRPSRWRRFRRVRLPRVSRVPRWALVGGGLLVAAALVLGLRAATGPVAQINPDPTPSPVAGELPRGPFDKLPGRTPIPAPTRQGDAVVGELPAVGGGPGERAAVASAQLVVGRYCLRPERYTLTAAELDGWLRVGVLVLGLDRSGDGPSLVIELIWTGATYRWTSPYDSLQDC